MRKVWVEKPELLELTSKIVAAHLSKNSVPPHDLPALIRSVHDALASTGLAPVPSATSGRPIT